MTTAVAPAPSKSTAQRKKASQRGPSQGTRRGNTIAGIAAWAVGILFVFPVFYMVLTSLHSEVNASTNPPSFFAPLTLQGYKEFFGASSGASPWPALINSATASIVSTILVILLAIPAAYALAVRPIKKWTDAMFFFLSTKMLPAVAGLLPLYIFAKYLGIARQHQLPVDLVHGDEPAHRCLDDAILPRRHPGRALRGRGGGRCRSGPDSA